MANGYLIRPAKHAMEDENEEINDPESNKSSPSKTEKEKGKKAGCLKIKEVDDDSESDKAGPSKAKEEAKARNVGCSEIEEEDDDLESNKAGPSRAPDNVPESLWRMIETYQKVTGQSYLDSVGYFFETFLAKQEKEKFDPKSIPDRAYEVKYLRAEVNKLSSQVDILKCKIDDLKSGHRSRSGYLWHKLTQLGSRISQLTHAIRFQSRIRAAIRRYQHRQRDGKSSPSLERVAKDEDERPEEQEQEASKSGRSEKESETAHQRYLRKGKDHVSELSTSKQLQEEDSVGILNLFDEIYANQLMLFEEVDLLLAEVNVLVYQALDLSKTTVCYEEAPTFPSIVAELIRLRVTTTIEPRSLFGRSLDLAEKVNLLRTQVMALKSLAANPKSPLRSWTASRIHAVSAHASLRKAHAWTRTSGGLSLLAAGQWTAGATEQGKKRSEIEREKAVRRQSKGKIPAATTCSQGMLKKEEVKLSSVESVNRDCRSALNVPKHFILISTGKCPQFHIGL
ncbi:hypothetical protein LguiB_026418 [Lonicera macranthoides]